jgi:hypothetical protein
LGAEGKAKSARNAYEGSMVAIAGVGPLVGLKRLGTRDASAHNISLLGVLAAGALKGEGANLCRPAFSFRWFSNPRRVDMRVIGTGSSDNNYGDRQMLCDGFNLYHAINDLRRPELKWVNLRAVAQITVGPQETLVGVITLPLSSTGTRKKRFGTVSTSRLSRLSALVFSKPISNRQISIVANFRVTAALTKKSNLT